MGGGGDNIPDSSDEANTANKRVGEHLKDIDPKQFGGIIKSLIPEDEEGRNQFMSDWATRIKNNRERYTAGLKKNPKDWWHLQQKAYDEAFSNPNHPVNQWQKEMDEKTKKVNRMGKNSKKHITPTENLKNKKRKNKMGENKDSNSGYVEFNQDDDDDGGWKEGMPLHDDYYEVMDKDPKTGKPKYDMKVLKEIEGDIDAEGQLNHGLADETGYDGTPHSKKLALQRLARQRISESVDDTASRLYEAGNGEEYEDAAKRARLIYNRRRGIKPKKVKNKMGSNGSAIFSGANTINFTNNGDGTDTVTPMGASAQDIKTAYRKAILNA